MSSKPLSKRQAICGICDTSCSNKFNLETHFKRHHPGQLVVEKGQQVLSFGQSASSSRKRPHTFVDTCEFGTDSVLSIQTNNLDTNNISQSTSTDLSDNLSDIAVIPASTSDIHCQYNEIIVHLKQINNQLQNHQIKPPLNSTCAPQNSPVSTTTSNGELINTIRACACLNDFATILNETFYYERVNDILRCICCASDAIVPDMPSSVSIPGVFSVDDVEVEKLPARSPKFRHLTAHLVDHVNSIGHCNKIAERDKRHKELAAKSARNREVGIKIGSLAYFFYYSKLPFALFERFLPWCTLNKIDIGQINHSEAFLRRLLDSCHRVLIKRLQNYMRQPLPCTGKLRPIAVMADKGTIKHDSLQLTLIKTLSLKKGVMFERFFVDNPEVTDGDGLSLTNLVINSVCQSLDISRDDLRQRFTGGCFDGQYIHLNVRRHLSTVLELPIELLNDSVTHDSAHKLELACADVKNGKVDKNGDLRRDTEGNIICPKTEWLIELDDILQHIMVHFRFGNHHTELHNIAREKNDVFLEFNLFSDTRFVEYSHRTYDHFVRMYHLLYEKLKRDEKTAVTRSDRNLSEKTTNLQNLLVQYEKVFDLLFMRDLSHVFMHVSKEFQRFDVLPFYPMNICEQLVESLISFADSFTNGVIPDGHKLHHGKQQYVVWGPFKTDTQDIIKSGEFKGVKLLLPHEKGRVTRRSTRYGCVDDALSNMLASRMCLYGDYIHRIVEHILTRFHPWPEWLILCNEAFNYQLENSDTNRKRALDKLMNCHSGPVPLLTEEKNRIKAEFVTFLDIVPKAKSDMHKSYTQTDFWYTLLTTEEYYQNCKYFIDYSLKFLNRTFNETIVESEVSSLEGIETNKRRLKHETSVKLNFISTNGPHPLVSVPLVNDFLTDFFGKEWHFTLSGSKWFTSKVVDGHFEAARNLANSLE